MTAPIQLNLLSPNIGICVGVAAEEAATLARRQRHDTDTKTTTAQASTAHDHHKRKDGPGEHQQPRGPKAIGKQSNAKPTRKAPGPVPTHAEPPRSSALSAEWRSTASVARRAGISLKRARKLLEDLYTRGVVDRGLYTAREGDGVGELWRLNDTVRVKVRTR